MPLLDQVESLIGVPQNPVAELLIIGTPCWLTINLFTYMEFIAVAIINSIRGKK